MTDSDSSLPLERRLPRRYVALALLSTRNEVLLIRREHQTRYGLPDTGVDRVADDDALIHAVTTLQATMLAEDTAVLNCAWLGRFAAPDDSGRLDMLEVYVARLNDAKLQSDVAFERVWAPLASPPPEDMIDPAIELQIMPALASLIDPQAPSPQ
ncbi:hypothetical protein SAMN05421848_2693 [Kushneria avicenniae]|uniref:ADP-ribose pyrophosphatase YjhB, NUDIX family n=1 Tax=Kushneria avicenniae TaxID=402385 RepID=A0A1I1LT30_9GAMM|nr:hypothetical protein [Kushneria avicenniae]SFC76294.1 hypothetical protein SAMN05421848_2693 [Kushneria avicenniae]